MVDVAQPRTFTYNAPARRTQFRYALSLLQLQAGQQRSPILLTRETSEPRAAEDEARQAKRASCPQMGPLPLLTAPADD